MDTESPITKQSSNYRPGEPLRPWGPEWPADIDIALVIKATNSADALVRLINEEPLSKDDIIAFGRLNAQCVMKWYEPLVNLLGPRSPQILPDHAELIRKNTKLFSGK